MDDLFALAEKLNKSLSCVQKLQIYCYHFLFVTKLAWYINPKRAEAYESTYKNALKYIQSRQSSVPPSDAQGS